MKNEKISFIDNENKFIISPEYVGCYRLGGVTGLSISLGKKPNWLHRKFMAICLGWEWIDKK